MLVDLQKALQRNQKVQVTVWDPQNDSVEYTFSSYILEAGGSLLQVAFPESELTHIRPLLLTGVSVGVVLETYPNPFIFYPIVHSTPGSEDIGFWLKILENPQLEMVQRRRHVRIQMVFPFELEYTISDRVLKMAARVQDLSGGGIRFTSMRLFPIGQELRISLPLMSGEPILALKARVVFSGHSRVKRQPDDLYVTACQFIELDDAKEMALVRECFRRELRRKQ